VTDQAQQYAMFAGDCPRCGQARTTFDILANTYIASRGGDDHYECFMQCRQCFRPSIGLLRRQLHGDGAPIKSAGNYANLWFAFVEWVFEVPNRRNCPEHVPADVQRVFDEAAKCAAVGAWDAAGTMFRKVLDVATRRITPKPESDNQLRPPNWKTYKDLRLRLDWLFENSLLSPALKELSSCIHEDGNDAAHDADGIRQAEAADLEDFTVSVLETLYTLPGQIAENQKRRDERRGIAATADAQPVT
jgi:hypothetical protein